MPVAGRHLSPEQLSTDERRVYAAALAISAEGGTPTMGSVGRRSGLKGGKLGRAFGNLRHCGLWPWPVAEWVQRRIDNADAVDRMPNDPSPALIHARTTLIRKGWPAHRLAIDERHTPPVEMPCLKSLPHTC